VHRQFIVIHSRDSFNGANTRSRGTATGQALNGHGDSSRSVLAHPDRNRALNPKGGVMAIAGALKVDCNVVFPHGLGVIGAVAPLADFDASTREKQVQARDKDTGLPMWSVDVIDFDPDARERTFKVKIAAAVQPVPPEAIPGAPVRPVILEGLTITPYIKDGERPKIAYSLRATGLVPARRHEQGKAA
jgi:hypothetical protein